MKQIDEYIYISIGQQLKNARTRKGYSLAYVAEKVGKTKVSIKRYEDAFVRIDLDTLNKIADVLDLKVVESSEILANGIEEKKFSLVPKETKEPIADNNFPNRLKEAMEYRNFRQVDLVNKTKIEKGTISNYLSGKYIPKQTNAIIIADALNVNALWLLGYESEPMIPEEPTENNENLSKLSDDMFNNFMGLDADTQRIVLMLLKIENIDEVMENIH